MTKIIQVKIKKVFLKLVFVVFHLVFLNCKAQQIKIFDIETFEKHKDHLNNYTFITNDSTVVEQDTWQFGYEETIKPKGEYIYTYNKYYRSGKLKLTGQFFPRDFEKGIWKEYDEQGNLIKETDYDKPYKFTWEDVLAFIKKRGFDMNNYYFEIIRGHNKKATTWTITYDKKDEHKLGVVSLDGITGKIIDEHDEEYPGED